MIKASKIASKLPRTEKQLEKMSLSHMGIGLSEKSKDKLSQSKLGTHASEEAKKNLSTSHIGQIPWNKGKTGVIRELR